MQIVNYMLARFSEPSSYAGIGTILAAFGWQLSDGMIGQVAQLAAAACGLVALVLRERATIGK